MRIARVEPLTTARALRGPFDYLLPDEMEGVGVGTVLEVPFGRRAATGVVIGLATESEVAPERLVSPRRILGEGVPAELVELGLWTAEEYCSTPARGLGLVLPPGTGVSGRRVRARSRLRAAITPEGRAALEAATGLGIRQVEVLRALAERDEAQAVSAIVSATGAGHATVRALERRGLLELEEVNERRAPAVTSVGASRGPIDLNPDQQDAVGALAASLAGERLERAYLLHGVTGSGKTEVYLAAAERALAAGRGVIALVPEIGLTPQAVTRFSERFGDRIAVLHSRLSDGERLDEWERLRTGEAVVCVGPRSAIFAPVRNLGLLIVDEEHDASYKQESDPRYDARTVAARRAEAEGALIVYGSATPRPESWHTLTRLELPNRVDSQAMPDVEIVDMRGAAAGPLHPVTQQALSGIRDAGGKAIILLNRRGWSAWVHCLVCGEAAGCPNCDVSLVLHRASGRLTCHHCGHDAGSPRHCPSCGSPSLAQARPGTERLAAELGTLLDPLPVFRLDTDAASRPGASEAVLAAFESAESGVLVGTQMVAKGHDFPDVVLSVVIDADATLRFPDFRAEERTFALVSQLAGRSGRGAAGGRVLVQTLAPEARAIVAAAAHDAAGFLEGEIDRRQVLSYPPFGHLIRVQVAAQLAPDAERASRDLASRIAPALPGARLLGPAPLFRVKGRHRRQIVVKSGERAPAVAAVRQAVIDAAAARELEGAAVSVDVDPQ